jgi:hypothetical protein
MAARFGLARGGAAAMVWENRRTDMRNIGLALTLTLAVATLSGCAPVIIGAGGAVIADKVVEQERGGDGLF